MMSRFFVVTCSVAIGTFQFFWFRCFPHCSVYLFSCMLATFRSLVDVVYRLEDQVKLLKQVAFVLAASVSRFDLSRAFAARMDS